MSDTYLPYAQGGGYLISHDLVKFVVANVDRFQFYNSEVRIKRACFTTNRAHRLLQDVSLGTWLAPLKITRQHDTRFDTEWMVGLYRGRKATHKSSLGGATTSTWSCTNRNSRILQQNTQL